MDWFVRITETYEKLEGFIEKLAESCDKLVVYEHGEEVSRKHIHFYAVQCKIKTDAIKVRVKKHLQVANYPKDKWAFETAYDDGCIVYMTKGKLEPVYCKGFTQEELIAYRDKWVDRTPETVRAVSKPTGPSQYDLAMEVYEIVKANKKLEDLHTIEIYELCVKASIKVHHQYRKGFCDHSLKKVVQTAYTKIEGCKDSLIRKMVDNFFNR